MAWEEATGLTDRTPLQFGLFVWQVLPSESLPRLSHTHKHLYAYTSSVPIITQLQ